MVGWLVGENKQVGTWDLIASPRTPIWINEESYFRLVVRPRRGEKGLKFPIFKSESNSGQGGKQYAFLYLNFMRNFVVLFIKVHLYENNVFDFFYCFNVFIFETKVTPPPQDNIEVLVLNLFG